MKKLLFLLLAVILPMAIHAQLLDNNRVSQRTPYALKSLNHHALMTSTRVDLADNQMIMGHYNTDDIAPSEQGLGFSTAGTRQIGTVLTPEEVAAFQGGKIVKFRVGLANAAKISKVLVAKVSASGSVGTLKSFTCNTNAAGWNEITLSTPYEISLTSTQGLFIGFEFQQTSGVYPLSFVQVGDIYPTLIKNGLSWQDLDVSSYGNLSVQCIVENDNFPEYLINVTQLTVDKFIKLGNDINFTFNTRNYGTATVAANACTYNVLIDGEPVTTTSNPQAMGNNTLTITGAIPSTGLASGTHTLTVIVNSLNGEPVANPSSVSREFKIFENSYARQMHLIEEFTSNSCMWCPLGARFINTVMNLRDDIAMVAIHGNQSAVDPYTTTESETLFDYMGGNGWPSAAFDRSVGWENYVSIFNGIGYYEQYHQEYAQYLGEFFDNLASETPSYATININSTFDADSRKVIVTIDGDISGDFDIMMGADAKLSVFLTEDGLVYRQNEEGTWVNDYVHNHVFRKALGSVMGVEINKVGNNKYSNTFEYTIPSDWNTDNMDIVAFISRPLANGANNVYTDLYVNQANKRKFGEFDEPSTSLRGDVNGSGVVNMDDLSELINFLLTNDASAINMEGADCNLSGVVNMDDLSELINFLLTGTWND